MSDTASKLDQALLAFHQDAESLDLAKNRSGHNAEYLDLDKSMAQIRPLLAKHGLFVQHYSGWMEGAGWYAGTRIVHAESGDRADSGIFPLVPVKPDAQGFGGALTYVRRYSLMEVLALVADNDDDGAGSSGRRRAPRAASGKITAAQRNEMMGAARAASVPTDRLKEIVKQVAGVEASAEIPAEKFPAVLAAIRKEKP